MPALPDRSEIVVIGGGVIGASIAFHLSDRGKHDVTLLERKRLTHGSTWHAAGLVGQLRSSSNLTQLMRESVRQYGMLESTTGYPTGWHGVGSVRVAASAERFEELKRIVTMGKSFGFDVQLTSAREAGELFPLLDLRGVHGATWVPSDGFVDPYQLTQSFAAGARSGGVRIIENCRAEALERRGRRIVAVITDQGRIDCDVCVNATGMWGAETARLAGVAVAVAAVEHQYVVTEKSDAIPLNLPTLRDPDARLYLKPEAAALVVGGWEEGTVAPWSVIPRDLEAELFEPNHERFAALAGGAAERIPLFSDLGIKSFVNGPIPFSPDAEPVMGLTEDFDNFFHCCGFSAGVAAAGGAGLAMANWIVDGDPGMDLWPFDVRRFGTQHNVPAYLEARAIDAYGSYYQIAYPNRELAAPRGQRRSALFGLLASRGARYGTKFGWERPSWFAPGGDVATEELSFRRTNAWPFIESEHRAVREGVGLADFSSFSKYEIAGSGALRLLQVIAGANIDVAVGKIVYSQLLNARGGIEADVTITRLGKDRFYLVTGSAFGRHDITFVEQHAPTDGTVAITDVTSAYGVVNLCGPRSRELAQLLSRSDFSNAAFPYMSAREVSIGHGPARALRATYVGELGYELHIPTEYVLGVYEQLLEAGETLRVRDIGYRAVNSLRLEKQYVSWSADVRADDNPFEAGLSFALDLSKPELLAGEALRKVANEGRARALCWFSTDAEVVMHGGELLTHVSSGLSASVRSAGFGFTVGRTILSAYVPVGLLDETLFGVEVAGESFAVERHHEPLYDPRGERVRV